jgi:lysophospholipid acyltransferase (LPLAT)-like uncharacterized protein
MTALRPPGSKIPLDAVSFAILALGNLLGHTWRYRITGRSDLDPLHDEGKGRIYCFWHSNLLPLAFVFRNTGKIAVVSESKDGTRAAAVAQRWHHGIIAGSSSHGGMAVLRESVRTLRNGNNIVITPDGPRGPREIVKQGVAQIALLAGSPVVSVTPLPNRAWRLHSWDRFMIPKPFTRIAIRLGDPLDPALSAQEPDPSAHFAARIQESMNL